MRTISADMGKVLTAAGGRAAFLRVQVQDAGATWRDLSSLEGYNFVKGARWSESIDQPVATADVQLFREVYDLSLATLKSGSKLNNLAGATPLLQVGRRIKIETATVPLGATPASGDWINAFDGYIGEIDWAGQTISLSCRDLGAAIQDRYIEKERVYGLNLAFGVLRSPRETAVSSGEYAIPAKDATAYYFPVSVAGTTGAKEPTWNTGGGNTSDGTVTWGAAVAYTTAGGNVETQMQAILDDTLGAGVVSLYTPTSPAWAVKVFVQRREPLLEALRALALQRGYDVRYRWDNGTSTFRLTFYEPDRTKVSPDRTFSASEYTSVRQLRQSIATIRNVVQVIFYNSATFDLVGLKKRVVVQATNTASVTKYGRRFCEITEGASSNIDTLTEATNLATSIVNDLCEPEAEQSVEMPYFFAAQLGDLYRFSANAVHYDADQDLAVVAIEHSFTESKASTVLTCRGAPAGAHREWLAMETRPGLAPATKDQAGAGPVAATTVAVFGGGEVKFTYSDSMNYDDAEIHMDSSSGFTPSSSTLVDAGKKSKFRIDSIPPGATRYVRVVLKDDKGNRAMSEELSVTAKYIEQADVKPVLTTGAMATRSADDAATEVGSAKEVKLNSETWDAQSAFNTSTYTFTAPSGGAGKYNVTAQVKLTGLAPGSSGALDLYKNGSTHVKGPAAMVAVEPVAGTNELVMTLSTAVALSAGDTLKLYMNTVDTTGGTSCTLVAAATFFRVEKTLEP